MASKIERLRDDANLVVQNQEADRARIGKLETIVAKLAKGNKGVDGSFTKLAVKQILKTFLWKNASKQCEISWHAIFQNCARHSVSDIVVIGRKRGRTGP